MRFAPLRRTRLVQPRGDRIDWSNPITAGLMLAFNGATGGDAVAAKAATATGTKSVIGKWHGVGFSSDGAGATDKVLTGVGGNGSNTRTLFALFKANSLGGGSLGRMFDANNLADNLYCFNSLNAFAGYFRHTNGSVRSIQFGTSSELVIGKAMSAAVSYDGSSVSNLPAGYINGISPSSQSFLDVPSAAGVLNPDNICIGNRPTDGVRGFDGTIYLALRWERVLSTAEHASIAANPWQIFL